jgi:hypothetical protein
LVAQGIAAGGTEDFYLAADGSVYIRPGVQSGSPNYGQTLATFSADGSAAVNTQKLRLDGRGIVLDLRNDYSIGSVADRIIALNMEGSATFGAGVQLGVDITATDPELDHAYLTTNQILKLQHTGSADRILFDSKSGIIDMEEFSPSSNVYSFGMVNDGQYFQFRSTGAGSPQSEIRVYINSSEKATFASTFVALESLFPLGASDTIGSTGSHHNYIYANYVRWDFSGTTFDNYDDLALIEACSPVKKPTVEMRQGKEREVYKVDTNTIPWPMFGAGEDMLDAADSSFFLLGAIKQLYGKHKGAVAEMKEEIARLTAKVEALANA